MAISGAEDRRNNCHGSYGGSQTGTEKPSESAAAARLGGIGAVEIAETATARDAYMPHGMVPVDTAMSPDAPDRCVTVALDH